MSEPVRVMPKKDRGVDEVLANVREYDPDEIVVVAIRGGREYKCFHSDFGTMRFLGAIELVKHHITSGL